MCACGSGPIIVRQDQLPKDRVLVPGKGIGGIVVGKSTVKDVLRTYGRDCYKRRSRDGKIYELDYTTDEQDEYRHGGPLARIRPFGFSFDDGIVTRIDIGLDQKDLETSGNIKAGSSVDLAKLVFGPDYELTLGYGDALYR
jgi:hypothetical protein